MKRCCSFLELASKPRTFKTATARLPSSSRRDSENLAMVEALLAAGADVALENRHGVSALTRANAAGATDIVTALRAAGARESLRARAARGDCRGSRR